MPPLLQEAPRAHMPAQIDAGDGKLPHWLPRTTLVAENAAFLTSQGITHNLIPERDAEAPTVRRPFGELTRGSSSNTVDTLLHKGIKIHGIRTDVITDESVVARIGDLAVLRINTTNGSEIVLPNGNPTHKETSYSLNNVIVETSADTTRFIYPTFINEDANYLASTDIEISALGIKKTIAFTPAEGDYNVLPHLEEGDRASMFVFPDQEGGKPTNYSLTGAEKSVTPDGVKYVLPATDNLASTTVITFDVTAEGVVQTTRIVPIGKVESDPDVIKAKELQAKPATQAALALEERRAFVVSSLRKAQATEREETERTEAKQRKEAELTEAKQRKAHGIAERRRLAVEEVWANALKNEPVNRDKLSRLFATPADNPASHIRTLHSAEVNSALGVDLSKNTGAELTVVHATKLAAENDRPSSPIHDIFVVTSLRKGSESTISAEPSIEVSEQTDLLPQTQRRIDQVHTSIGAGPAAPRTRNIR